MRLAHGPTSMFLVKTYKGMTLSWLKVSKSINKLNNFHENKRENYIKINQKLQQHYFDLLIAINSHIAEILTRQDSEDERRVVGC